MIDQGILLTILGEVFPCCPTERAREPSGDRRASSDRVCTDWLNTANPATNQVKVEY
jgi:hypothetical protein